MLLIAQQMATHLGSEKRPIRGSFLVDKKFAFAVYKTQSISQANERAKKSELNHPLKVG
jgi:hypothetical protein